ncbi:MAG: hypothetical protein QHJ82_02590, partial [Verrucomicrobiota bacterium]|nr:hypothetical protein [Verrucomicrobiota bacterium]
NVQRSTLNVQRATCKVQRARCNVQPGTGPMDDSLNCGHGTLFFGHSSQPLLPSLETSALVKRPGADA